MNTEILEFIKQFSKFGKPVTTAFTQGCCYWFAYILKSRFPTGRILYLPAEKHFVTEIDYKLFDIEGNVTKKYINSKKDDWNTLQERQPDIAKSIANDCVLLKNV